MTALDVRLQEGIGREGLAAHKALGDRSHGCLVHARRPAAALSELRLEHADVLRLVAQLTLRRAERRLERDVAPVKRLLHVEQVLAHELQQAEELHEVSLAEPVQVVSGHVRKGHTLQVLLERVDVDLAYDTVEIEL